MKTWQENLLCRFSTKKIPSACKTCPSWEDCRLQRRFLRRWSRPSVCHLCWSLCGFPLHQHGPGCEGRSFRFVKTFVSELRSRCRRHLEHSSELGTEVFFFFLYVFVFQSKICGESGYLFSKLWNTADLLPLYSLGSGRGTLRALLPSHLSALSPPTPSVPQTRLLPPSVLP